MPGCGARVTDPSLKNATCLFDNVIFGALQLGAKEKMHFHWYLDAADRAFIANLDEDDPQRLLTFRITTCFGNVHLYINGLRDFPTNEKFMYAPDEQDSALLSIGVPINFGEYFVTVEGIAPTSNFTIAALLGGSHIPTLGAGGAVWTKVSTTLAEIHMNCQHSIVTWMPVLLLSLTFAF